MSSHRRNMQRRMAARAQKEEYGPLAGETSLPNPRSAADAVGSVVVSALPHALVRASDSLSHWFSEREHVKSYGAIAGPIILVASTVTLSQAGQFINIVKSVKKIFGGGANPSPTPVDVQQKYEYANAVPKDERYDWGNVAIVASLISLKLPDFTSRTVAGLKLPRVSPSAIAKLYLAGRLLRWFAATAWKRIKSPIGAVVQTALISATLESDSLSSSQKRQIWADLPLVISEPVDNHSHGDSASKRTGAGNTAALMALQLALQPYFVQMSLADVRKRREGDRSYHWCKDLGIPAKEFHFDPRKHAGILVDVDEHMDMPHLLATYPGTYFICTFQPTAAAKADGEYTFRFLADGQVQYRVSGGALFQHRIWHYDGDTLVAEDASFLSKTVVAYHVDRKAVDEHHAVIMLSVLGKFIMPTCVPTSWILNGTPLARLNPIVGNHVVLDVVRKEGLERSVAITGSNLCVTLLKARYDAVHAVAIVARTAITPGMVDSNISPPGENGMPLFKLGPGQAAVVASYLREGVPLFPPTVCPASDCVVPVRYDKNGYDSPIPLAGFGAPLIGPNYAHADDIASDDRCIKGRVEAFTGGRVEKDIKPSLANYMEEFAKLLIPDRLAGAGRPVDHERVHELQNRPSQRVILDEAEDTGPWYKRLFRTFVKKEVQRKPGSDPRNITTVTPASKLRNSRYMYAFHEDVMSQCTHYAFNKSPKEIAERVASTLKSAKWSVIADGFRFDGHVGRKARILERVLMFRYYHPDEHSELNETLDEQIGMPAVTKEGRRYGSHYTRGSGTLETSDFNSVESMFIGYCAWRNTVVNGQKCSPSEAWASLGIYGGDDSLEGCVDPAALQRSAEMMGQEYEIEVFPRGSAGVNFLNRFYGPDVWNGDCNSMAASARLLSKLWIGPAKLHNPLQRFAERLSGYYRTDRNSPIIGDICRVGHALLGARADGELMPWDGRHPVETNWPNEDSGWMMDLFVKDLPDFDHDRFTKWIAHLWATKDASLLLQAPLCTPPPPAPVVKVESLVGDDMVVPASGSAPKEKEDEQGHDETTDSSEATVEDFEDAAAAAAVPSSVKAAVEAVPLLTKKGLKKKPAAPGLDRKANDGFDPKRPDLWTPPKDPERLPAWLAHQAKVAKRLGIKLAQPKKG